ncbi:hypothetical protein PHYBOEH_009269 [Phytophthora boehmeriae]|uniref:Uncharacterized protein n=1 Tax=Phytophthora boehmeriae TaxID=109152 RepID=A0A8T1VUG6_9STRA|nr:hypothetical protein PHYBOEH_009269 [Phytophthora boehmeriae]
MEGRKQSLRSATNPKPRQEYFPGDMGPDQESDEDFDAEEDVQANSEAEELLSDAELDEGQRSPRQTLQEISQEGSSVNDTGVSETVVERDVELSAPSVERTVETGMKRKHVRGSSAHRDARGDTIELTSDEDCPPSLQFLAEREPRDRASETSTERLAIIAAHRHIKMQVPVVQRKLYKSWGSLQRVVKAYQKETGYVYRVRDSMSTQAYNR